MTELISFIDALVRSFFWFGGIVFWLGAVIFMKSKLVDKSNIFNFIRSFAMMCKHASELVSTYYLTPQQIEVLGGTVKKAFPYIQYDEFSDLMDSRKP